MSSAADVRCDGQDCGGDLLVMKQNDESLPLKKRKKRKCSRRTGFPLLPSSPTNPFPSFLCACVFDFLTPSLRPCLSSTGIISIQAHTEHCKLISLGYSHRKSGCQTLFPPQCLSAQPASGLGPCTGPLRTGCLF